MASTNITLTNAYLDGGVYRSTVPSFGWDEFDDPPFLYTWADWTDWPFTDEFAGGFTITLLDSLDSVDFRRPIINYGILGDISVTLDISQTGSFSGEETTIEFTLGQTESYVQGRYYRWTLDVTPNSDYPIPALGNIRTAYNTQTDVEYFNDLELAGLEDSTGIKTVPTTIGLVTNVQGTALQGEFYVDEGYFIVEQNSDTEYVRDSVSVFNGGVESVASTQFPGYTAGDWDGITGTDYLRIDNFRNVFAFDTTWTLEFWVNFSAIDRNHLIFNIDDNSYFNDIVFSISFLNNDSIFMHIDNDDFDIGDALLRGNSSAIQANTWHHIAITCTPGSSATLWIDGVDETRSASATPSSLPATTRPLDIGAWDQNNTGNHSVVDAFDGLMQWIRLSNTIRYTSTFTPHNYPLTNDGDTVLLIQDTADLPGENYGADNYIVRQQGGSVVVESKNPLRVKTVDYDGNEWDGTVDLVVRGLKTIKQNARGVS